MNLYLVRHGQTDWNVEGRIQGSKDIELNSFGIKQAEELSSKIADSDYNVSRIYSSHLKRAAKTAEIMSNLTNVEYIVVKGLEEINLGIWEGFSWDEVQEKYPLEFNTWFNNRRYTNPPNGESYQDMLDRVLIALQEIIENNEEDVIVVTHSAVIMSLQCYITNTPFENMTKFKTDNTSITKIDRDLLLI